MITQNVEETKQFAGKFLSQLLVEGQKNGATVVALSGDLGSGKTTFTQAVASLLGIKEEIVSPTFVIEKIYKIDASQFSHFIHIDAYKIEDDAEMVAIGFNDIVSNPKNLIFIEWPERIHNLIPKPFIAIKFEHTQEENARDITFEYDKK